MTAVSATCLTSVHVPWLLHEQILGLADQTAAENRTATEPVDVLMLHRCRYYFVWTLGEACFAFGGLDFNGWDEATGKAKWGRCSNAEPAAVELCDSGRRLAAHWNIGTGRFLRR